MINTKMAVDLISQFEGLKLKSYSDSKGVWTIGFGSTEIDSKHVTKGMSCTVDQAKKWLYDYVDSDAKELEKWCHENNIKLNNYQCAAILSFTYNIGFMRFKISSIAKYLLENNLENAAISLQKYNKIRIGDKFVVCDGLVKRRKVESMYLLRSDIND